MRIEFAQETSLNQIATLRALLWPSLSAEQHLERLRKLSQRLSYLSLIALSDEGKAIGFAEAALRTDHVNGCSSSPVLFLEGVFVVPEARGHGVGRALIEYIADWGRAAGCSKMASDTAIANHAGQAFHLASGFAETERVVFFKRKL